MKIKNRQWKVESIHALGYTASSFFVESFEERLNKAELEALNLAKQKSHLSKFDCWTIRVILQDTVLYNGKWISDSERTYKIALEKARKEANRR